MTTTHAILRKRRIYLAAGVFAMLFSGILYAWSILKLPFKESFGWSDSALAFNFTLTMCFFCISAFLGSIVCRKIGPRITLIAAGILAGGGFFATAFLSAEHVFLMYLCYAVIAATGIGCSYNVVVSTVTAWFPDRKGFCSGCLMLGFGISTLLLGNLISVLFEIPAFGWRRTYMLLGAALALVLVISGLILRRPDANTPLPAPKPGKHKHTEAFAVRDYSTLEMLKNFTFWRAFVCLAFITAVGNSVISFVRDLVLSLDASPALATALVGILAVFNGIGRVLTGEVYDTLGRRTTMIAANILTIVAAAATLLSILLHSLPMCIVGLCLTGLSYGSCPTVTSAFSSSFYGQKYFPINYSITNFNLIAAAFIAALSNNLLISTGTYTASFILLLALAVCALGLNFTIRKP